MQPTTYLLFALCWYHKIPAQFLHSWTLGQKQLTIRFVQPKTNVNAEHWVLILDFQIIAPILCTGVKSANSWPIFNLHFVNITKGHLQICMTRKGARTLNLDLKIKQWSLLDYPIVRDNLEMCKLMLHLKSAFCQYQKGLYNLLSTFSFKSNPQIQKRKMCKI